jgi:L-ascorbate metabolism protein UlaG (beta-lactamase superfamily)
MPVTITWHLHSCFTVSDGERSLLIDPMMNFQPGSPHFTDTLTPDAVLITHAHNDHVGDTVAIARRTGATVVAEFEIAEWLQRQGVENVVDGAPGGTVPFPGGTAKFVPAIHSSSYWDGQQQVAIGHACGLVVRFGGKTIYFAGDTALFGDMQLIGDEGLDLAVLPIGDRYTMGPADALRAVELLRPQAVLPCHYNTFPAIAQDGQAFADAVTARTGARGLVLAPGESLTL